MLEKIILVIDDEEDFCHFIKKSIESKGVFQVLTATKGREGIRLAKTRKPDIILLDIMMPDIAGTEVAEELSEDPLTASMPIIYVTAIISKEEIRKSGGVIGGRNFIAKPIVLNELLNKIKTLLS
jgi:DNA-binding response OmpR family regulator